MDAGQPLRLEEPGCRKGSRGGRPAGHQVQNEWQEREERSCHRNGGAAELDHGSSARPAADTHCAFANLLTESISKRTFA
jgi:hypothetical protein